MPTHREFARAFQKGIGSGALPPGLTAREPDEADRRFAVYRNNVVHGLKQALKQRFPAIERLVGAEFFNAMAQVFIQAFPPDGPILQRWGAAMPEFLEGFSPVASLPYLADVARVELARGRAYHAGDAAPVDPTRLTEVALSDPEAMVLALHPSVQLLALALPGGSIWAAQQPGGPAAPDIWGPEQVLVARTGLSDVRVRLLPPSEAAFLAALSKGVPFRAAVHAARMQERGFDPAPALATLLTAGLIVDVSLTEKGEFR